VFPARYKLDFYIPEDDILRSYLRENLKSYIDNGSSSSYGGWSWR
jgi:hypothetical protein